MVYYLLLVFRCLAEILIFVLLGISVNLVSFWIIVSMLMQWSDAIAVIL